MEKDYVEAFERYFKKNKYTLFIQLVYFDNAATSQTPQQVIDAIVDYFNYNANIHRGVHVLSQEATDKYEQARQKIQKHFNAGKFHEVLLIRAFSNQKPQDILNADNEFIDEIGLKEHLSPTRANGLVSMIKQLKLYAVAYQTQIEE